MKTTIHLTTLAAFFLLALTAKAATNVVIAGDNFQAKIDAAAPGDTLVVQAGIYSGNLNFTKPLTIVRSGTNQLQFTGNASISTTGRVTVSQVQFAGTLSTTTNATIALFQVVCNGTISLTGGANFEAYDSQFATFNATGGRSVIKRSSFSGAFSANNTSVESLRVTNASTVVATASIGSGKRFVIAQSYLQFGVNLSGYAAWLGYNSIVQQAYLTDCDAVLVGNKVANVFNTCGTCVVVTRGTCKAYNNFFDVTGSNNYCDRQFRGLIIDSAQAEIANNTIHVGINWVDNQGSGGYVVEAVGDAKISIRGCILYLTGNVPGPPYSNYAGIVGTAEQITSVSFCDVYFATSWSPPQFVGGVTGLNCFAADALFNPDGTLSPGSPCINAGPPDPIYNDRDGSRNDIGYTGGPLWNPANYTNNSPMVFWLMPTNQTVLKGLQSTIPINAAATAGH